MPNSNLFTRRMLFFSREATSEIYGPRVYSLSYLLWDLFLFAFVFRSVILKTQKYLAALFLSLFYFILLRDLFIQNHTNQYIFYPGGIDNPSDASGCKYLFFVCRYRLHSVAWFSYWFDNLGFITEGNTYRSCTASSLPLWGNTNVVQATSKGISGTVARETSSTSTRSLIINLISLQFTLFSICLSFSSPPLHKNLPFYSPPFLFAFFLIRSLAWLLCCYG